jgi:hypothetical protein
LLEGLTARKTYAVLADDASTKAKTKIPLVTCNMRETLCGLLNCPVEMQLGPEIHCTRSSRGTNLTVLRSERHGDVIPVWPSALWVIRGRRL